MMAMAGTRADRPKLHDRPVIGVMAVMIDGSSLGRYVLPGAYVKSLEACGARVVALLPEQSEQYYKRMFNRLNGLLIPGGSGAPTTLQLPVTKAVAYFYQWSIEAYAAEPSVYWPIWGTCLGLEILLDIGEGMSGNLLQRCEVAAKSFPMTLTEESKSSRMISSLPADLIEAIPERPLLPHLHSYCVSVDRFKETGLDQLYTLIGTNRDRAGINYVTAVEARHGAPIYAVMAHPEKAIYSWTRRFDYDRSADSIRLAQAFSNFFVQECCKNAHHFANEQEEREAMIYNHNPIHTAKATPGSISEQSYFF